MSLSNWPRVATLLVPLAGCAVYIPQGITPGFVDTSGRPDAGVSGSAQLGAGMIWYDDGNDAWGDFGGGGGLRIEPFATQDVSVPVEAAFQYTSDGGAVIGTRAGLRARLTDGFALGVGLGPTFCLTDWASCAWGGALDVELAWGGGGPRGAWSISTRPGLAFTTRADHSDAGQLPSSFSVPVGISGVANLGAGMGLGATLMVGLGFSQGFVGGGGGVMLTLVGFGEDLRQRSPSRN